MTAGQEFARAVGEKAASVLAHRAIETAIFSIGPLAVRLTGPAGHPANWLGRAFAPEQPRSGDAVHHLIAWDGDSEEEMPPRAPWRATAPEPLGFVASHSDENLRCAIDIHTDSLLVTDFAVGKSYTWYPRIETLPAWAKASPFRIPLSWLCNRHNMQIIHGAAVGIDGRAVLLAGDGGSGKSTTALACALAGFQYLGDDYCAVEPSERRVHMVYRTAKMFKTTLDLLPSMTERVENRHLMEEEKGVSFLDPGHVKLSRTAMLSAILLPRVGNVHRPVVYPATRQDVVKAVLPSTIGGLMGGTRETPRMIMELARKLPAYHLVLGPDLRAVVDLVAEKVLVA